MISEGAICSRRDAVNLPTNEALQRRASERPLVGCYAELGSATAAYFAHRRAFLLFRRTLVQLLSRLGVGGRQTRNRLETCRRVLCIFFALPVNARTRKIMKRIQRVDVARPQRLG